MRRLVPMISGDEYDLLTRRGRRVRRPCRAGRRAAVKRRYRRRERRLKRVADDLKQRDRERQEQRQRRELAAIAEAKRSGKVLKYIDDDGCEVTVTPTGYAFYNAADWF
jgi:hypothetical protein